MPTNDPPPYEPTHDWMRYVSTGAGGALTTYNVGSDELVKVRQQLIVSEAEKKVLETRLENKTDRLNEAEDENEILLSNLTDKDQSLRKITFIIAEMSTESTTASSAYSNGEADKYRRALNKIITVLKQDPKDV